MKDIEVFIFVCDSIDEKKEGTFAATIAYIRSYPSLKFYSYPTNSLDRSHQKTFIAQSTISVVKKVADVFLAAENQRTIQTAVSEFVCWSTVPN